MTGKSVLILLRTLYDGEQKSFSDATSVDCSVDPDTGEELVSLTKQSFAAECDINEIMARYEKTGTIDHINRAMPRFEDVSSLMTFQEAQNFVINASAEFMALPAKVRKRFNNDPGELLAFLEDPENRAEAIALGVVQAPEPPPPEPSPPEPPEPPEAA